MKEYKPDYLNTVIYKISCKMSDIDDIYIGHTTNFKSRIQGHRSSSRKSNLKIYQIIRKNGGWDNWKMEIIKNHPCDCLFEALKEEQRYYNLLKPSMNSTPPIRHFEIERQNKKNLDRVNRKLEKQHNFYKERHLKEEEQHKLFKIEYQMRRVVFGLYYLIKNNNKTELLY